jgi:(p)ppGpp synthase/HD superfamily hydrolase
VSYSAEVERALLVCLEAHYGQFRKGGEGVHYSVHPIHMALILARAGVRQELIQAALLHDVVEDCDGWTMERLRSEFGDEVADIVDQLTEDKSLTWQQRKQWAIEHVDQMCDDSVVVKAADKLHNLQSLAAQLELAEDREQVWQHFKGGREGTLMMDQKLVMTLKGRVPASLAGQLIEALERVEQLS